MNEQEHKDSAPSVTADAGEVALAVERLEHELLITAEPESGMAKDIRTVCAALTAAKPSSAPAGEAESAQECDPLVREIIKVHQCIPRHASWTVIPHPRSGESVWLRDYLFELANDLDNRRLATLRNSGAAPSAKALEEIVRAAIPVIHRAEADPGFYTPRGDNYTEDMHSWQKRALDIALAGHFKQVAGAEGFWKTESEENPG